ncbi:hypothetical protein EVAR_82055_1 [Eumeta japonica]|uniref:N-acetyltransferase domain-containing protein n=1 Tax=Eumeta variegata TaxID=151549 RepID=A0A4C1U1J8_EUMVA|nr:hypothetical protein EVAR_82055_1 [Eumeta japonica]
MFHFMNTNYQIRDIRPEDHKPCLDLMKEVFIRDEPLVQALDVASDPVSLKTIVKNWEKYLEEKISLACYTEDDKGEPQELVGFNILLMKNIDDPDEDLDKIEGEPWKKLLRTLIAAEQTCDVFQRYGVDRYLTSSGLTVREQHRGQNIGAEIFKAREPLCKALGVQATATVFTALTSQALAAKCGYELLGELEYTSMLDEGIDLSRCDTPTAKHMGRKF